MTISPRAFQAPATTSAHPVMSFAREELTRWLSAAGLAEAMDGQAAWRFSVEVDRQAAPCSFGFEPAGEAVRIWGADESCALHGVYTLLETIGYRFQITGPLLPKEPLLDGLSGPVTIQPPVITRGIRQHLNFPMDISSYPLDEALAYVRNLARLRFNHITFHSYPNQFIALPGQGPAGFFFYGQRHPVPQSPLFRRCVRNQSVFCIPEIEPAFDRWEERGRQAVAWLRAVISEAKRVGLQTQFSFEPRRRDAAISETLANCAAVVETYPELDVIELMTQETGNWGETQPVETVLETVEELFGPGADATPGLAQLLDRDQPDLGRVLGELGHNLLVVRRLRQEWQGSARGVSVGLYCTVARYLPVCLRLYERAAEGAPLRLLAGHGSDAVAETVAALREAQLLPASAGIYSWLEFDGLMFLQQNAIPGIGNLLDLGVTAVSFNHWRTAENRSVARFAALAALLGETSDGAFYARDAAELDIGSPDDYATAMRLLGEAGARATTGLPNIGFCYVGVWGDSGAGLLATWDAAVVAEVRALYEAAHGHLRSALRATSAGPGRPWLSFLVNRVRCAILYLNGISAALPVVPIVDNRSAQSLTLAERTQVRRICSAALAAFRRYLGYHARLMPDRGCEGTLLSAFYTPMSVLRRIRQEYGGGARDPWQPQYEAADAPRAPIAAEPASREED